MKKKKSTPQKRMTEEEFDRQFQEADFGAQPNAPEPVMIRARARRGRPAVGRKFNVVMPEELIARLREAGDHWGIGYQTMVRVICSEHVGEYLKERRKKSVVES